MYHGTIWYHGIRVRTNGTCSVVIFNNRYGMPSGTRIRTQLAAAHPQNTRGSQCTCVPFSNQKAVT